MSFDRHHVCLLLLLVLQACGIRYWVCDEPELAQLQSLPGTLSETQLYADIAHDTLAEGVLAYRPEFELWSDGADKRRWIALPPGERIDTTDMTEWRFPTGTKLWKEFVRDGVRVETRILAKVGPNDRDWVAAAYIWKPDQSDAVIAPEGGQDVLGTPHDVPTAGKCMGCHGGRHSRVLGFAALQLAQPAQPGAVDLAALSDRGLLTASPTQSVHIPGDEAQRAALGYLYANCAHCHNASRPQQQGARCYAPRGAIDYSLPLNGTLEQTGIYRTGVDAAFVPGHPERSEMVRRMAKRGIAAMPPLASERLDEQALTLMRTWIAHH